MIFDGLQTYHLIRKCSKATRFGSCWFCHGTTEYKWPPHQLLGHFLDGSGDGICNSTCRSDIWEGLDKEGLQDPNGFCKYQNHPKPADTHGGTEDDALQIICRLWLEGPGQVHDGVSMSSLLREQNEAMPCKHFTAANGATSVDPLVRPAPLAQKEKFIENWLWHNDPRTFQVLPLLWGLL